MSHSVKKNELLFDNERVKFLLRRIVERAAKDFRKMLNMTVSKYGEHWNAVWLATLPKIRQWPTASIASIGDEFMRDVPNAKLLTELMYIRYVCLGYGKDAYGMKNKLEVEMVSFQTLYHAFLIRLSRTPEMMAATWFTKPEEMDRICANALLDALHDTAETRVRILKPEASAPAPAPTPTPIRITAPTLIPLPAFTPVTSSDSASQVHSLGLQYQKLTQGARPPRVIPRIDEDEVLPSPVETSPDDKEDEDHSGDDRAASRATKPSPSVVSTKTAALPTLTPPSFLSHLFDAPLPATHADDDALSKVDFPFDSRVSLPAQTSTKALSRIITFNTAPAAVPATSAAAAGGRPRPRKLTATDTDVESGSDSNSDVDE
jgi:hypothetical protein